MTTSKINWNTQSLSDIMRAITIEQNIAPGYLPNIQTALACIALQEIGFPGVLQARKQTFDNAEGTRSLYAISFNGETLNLAGHTFDEILDGRYASKMREDLVVSSTEDVDVAGNVKAWLKTTYEDKMGQARASVAAWSASQVAAPEPNKQRASP